MLIERVVETVRREAGGEVGRVLYASRGPWFGFNGLFVVAVGGARVWIGRQEIPLLTPVRVRQLPLSDVVLRRGGRKRVHMESFGTLAFKSSDEADEFVALAHAAE